MTCLLAHLLIMLWVLQDSCFADAILGPDELWEGCRRFINPDLCLPLEFINEMTYAATDVCLQSIRLKLS